MIQPRLFLIGPPCCGKTTVGRELARRNSWHYFSSGDVARDLAKDDPETRAALEVGQMAPPAKMDTMLLDKIIENVPNGPGVIRGITTFLEQTRVVDGYPRYMEQLVDLLSIYTPHSQPWFVVFDVSSAVLLQRHVQRARMGEDNGAFMTRLRYYHSETVRVAEYVRSRHPERILVVDGLLDFNDSVWRISRWFTSNVELR